MIGSKRESVGLKHCNDPKAFIEYFSFMKDIYENVDEYNSNDMATDWSVTKNILVTELLIRGRKLKFL